MAPRTPPRIAAPIRARIAFLGIRQQDLADLLGEKQNWISKRLTGEVKISVIDLERIASALGVTLTELYAQQIDDDLQRVS
jgi:transcriptional regulator with XRE-family HTH domain